MDIDCTFNRDDPIQRSRDVDDDQAQISSSETLDDNTHLASPTAFEQTLSSKIEEMIVVKYFSIENHTFPLYSYASFSRQLQQSRADRGITSNDPAWMASLHGVLAACGPHVQLAEPGFNEDTARKHLQTALSYTDQIITRSPTIPGVQALVCIVACARHPIFSDEPSMNLLAVAIRMAYSLGLHRVNQSSGLSTEDRLEQIRLFWCLYILDKELAFDQNTPPLIDDAEIDVLEPRMRSVDDLGIVESMEGLVALNLFTARQRLAKIASKIWKEMHTFKSKHRRTRERLEWTMELNEQLARWKIDWLDYGSATDVATLWTEEAIQQLATVQCRYFKCLLMRNYDRPYNAVEALESLKNGQELDHQALNLCCFVAARDTLHLTRSVRKGGMLYIL